jgi:hypothetical protein
MCINECYNISAVELVVLIFENRIVEETHETPSVSTLALVVMLERLAAASVAPRSIV